MPLSVRGRWSRSDNQEVGLEADERSRRGAVLRPVSVLAMSAPEAHQESEAVSLAFGLLAVIGLFFISIIAIAGPAWLGLVFGLVELVVAWRLTPPAGARSLRIVTGLMGALTVASSVLRLFVS